MTTVIHIWKCFGCYKMIEDPDVEPAPNPNSNTNSPHDLLCPPCLEKALDEMEEEMRS